jgi:DnaK suppressor protein
MTKHDIMHLRELLMERRKEILNRVRQLQAGLQGLGERSIELEEEAQKATITEAYDKLDHSGKKEIELIDFALVKMSVGEYGICENCGDDIDLRRLKILPMARLCVECAREFEKKREVLPLTTEVMPSGKMPDEYQGLGNDAIVKRIYNRLRTDKRINTEHLKVTVRRGIVYLEGVLSGEPEHQVIMQTLTDVMGFSSIVDRLDVNEFFREEDDHAEEAYQEGATSEDRLLYGQEDLSEDLFEAGDGTPYSPPERPLPYEEHKGYD